MKKFIGDFLLLVSLIILTFSCISHAETIEIPFKEVQTKMACSSVQEKAFEINFQHKLYHVAFDNLYSNPVVNTALVCQRFLASLREVTKPSPIISFTKKYTKFGLDIYIDESGFLEHLCLELGFCKRGILDTFKLKKVLRECHGKVTLKGLIEKSRPKIRGYQTNIIKDVSIKVHPFHPFVNILNDYLQDSKLSEDHASTMTLGNQALVEISKNALEHNKKVVINYDAGVSLFNRQERQIAQVAGRSSKIHFLPMTSGHNFNYFYHIKYIASPDTHKSMLASMNLSSADRTPYLDLNFFFEDPAIRDEFLSISANNNKRFCSYSDDYDCLARFYNDKDSNHIPFLINQSCPTNDSNTKIKRSGYFVNSEDDDLVKFVNNFINQAKEEVIVTSYKLTERSIANTLIEKQNEGLKVHAMLAFKSPVLNELRDHFYSGDIVKDQYPFPHMKIIVIDRRLMLLGTANFTVNALNNTTELLGITDNQLAIQTALDHVAVFTQSKNLALSKNLSGTPKQNNYVAVSNAGDIDLANLQHTKILKQPWMANYREVTKKGKKLLKKCGLEHLVFLNKSTYLACLKKELGDI